MSFLTRSPIRSIFPIYLFPSISFRRQGLSTDYEASNKSIPSLEALRGPRQYLEGHISRIQCARCAIDLCPTSQIISKGFTGRHGRAYLVSATPPVDGLYSTSMMNDTQSLPNTHKHKAVPRQLVTGAHIVSDVSCAFCGSVIGWKYEDAEEESQMYKVGKFILETKKIYSSSCWEANGWDELGEQYAADLSVKHSNESTLNRESTASTEFDSQDEDECQDLFAGVWSPDFTVKRRRERRVERVITRISSSPL